MVNTGIAGILRTNGSEQMIEEDCEVLERGLKVGKAKIGALRLFDEKRIEDSMARRIPAQDSLERDAVAGGKACLSKERHRDCHRTARWSLDGGKTVLERVRHRSAKALGIRGVVDLGRVGYRPHTDQGDGFDFLAAGLEAGA